MTTARAERTTYELFRISVLLKGANALLEIVGGALALLIPPSAITALASYLTQGELTEDPNDFIATHLLAWANSFAVRGHLFAGLYLLSHGIVKSVLVVGLLRNRLWAYPASLVVFGLFVLYQMYLYTLNHASLLIALTLFDFVVMWLIWREYAIVRSHRAAAEKSGSESI
ncbi:MAG: DUF2127 domain-containing protein [Proteobacteria bacterium]|nr:DUF2127 domain-containing protein [Pseudomonadota bacterium]